MDFETHEDLSLTSDYQKVIERVAAASWAAEDHRAAWNGAEHGMITLDLGPGLDGGLMVIHAMA